MSIDAKTDKLLTLAEVAALGANFTRLAPWKLRRWHTRGIFARGGRRVRLEIVRMGGDWYTTEAAILEFFAALDREEE